MRCLAVARYRLLTTLRAANSVFVTAVVVVLIPPVGAGAMFQMDSAFRSLAEGGLLFSGVPALIAPLLHGLVMLGACLGFGAAGRRRDAETSDLMDLAPVTPQDRFWGDAIGILASALIVHVCTLPLLAMAVAQSSITTSAFAAYEIVLLAAMVLASAGASWQLHAAPTRWSQTRSARNAATFLILLLLALIVNTRWEAFRDALGNLVNEPSARKWTAVVAAVNSPLLLFLSLFLLYAGFLFFYWRRATRSLEIR
jgi:hypothetical protein